MPGEGRVRSSEPDEAPAARSAHADGSVSLALIAGPDIPEKIAKELATDLPTLLSNHLDNSVYWNVSVVVDPRSRAPSGKLPRSSTSATSA